MQLSHHRIIAAVTTLITMIALAAAATPPAARAQARIQDVPDRDDRMYFLTIFGRKYIR